jgi:hypothetical protein
LQPVLIEHMDFEETHVVPLMEQHVTQAEWDNGAAALGQRRWTALRSALLELNDVAGSEGP